MSSCSRAAAWPMSLALMTSAQRGADVVVYGALLSACGKGQRWSDALLLLKEMRGRQLRPNTVACVTARRSEA